MKKEIFTIIYNKFKKDAIIGISENIINRMEFENKDADALCEELWQAMDDELIYYEDLWEIMKYYQLPNDANFLNAIEKYQMDLYDVVADIAKIV